MTYFFKGKQLQIDNKTYTIRLINKEHESKIMFAVYKIVLINIRNINGQFMHFKIEHIEKYFDN